MSETLELTYSDVSTHNSKKVPYCLISLAKKEKICEADGGGEEVLLDVGGQDATEAFEDVGHSDEAREILQGLLIGNLKRKPGDPAPSTPAPSAKLVSPNGQNATGLGVGLYAFVLLGGVLAFGLYRYLQTNTNTQAAS